MDVERFDVAPDGWWDEDDLESREVVAPAGTSTEDSTESAASEEDRILLLASQQYEDEASSNAVESPETSASARFGAPVTAMSIDQLITSKVPAKTRKTTQWAINVWKEWAVFRTSSASRDEEGAHGLNEDFVSMNAADQSFWMCRTD
ncbi:hypothetical protein GBAR_LOCUS11349 [Geodia barretti]|uniref:Uncharacterized protein n=1 Tax=Geodia barretti TaxID=519541 RepID=A0AA35WER8_GEOBA|nr:hypothetical protein GBAR_LOCUS11349 [Geodia barretti]